MANKHGDFIWYELLTTDAGAAQTFYSAILGWTFKDSGQANVDYRIFSMNNNNVGGLMQLTPEMTKGGARPVWLGYIGVNDVDTSTAQIKAAGGSVHMGPQDIPDVGRIAMVTDPQGVAFYVMKGSVEGGTSNSFASDRPMDGHCAWNELSTTAPAEATQFYTDQFDWRQEGEMDMGPLGKYQFLYHGPKMIGAIMPKMPQMPIPMWTYYFRVPDIDKAMETINAKGGNITHGPDEIPGGEFSLSAMDPQGAPFALVGKRNA